MSNQDWRIEVNSADYFGHQKKRVATEERRPVIRKGSDLVGPGIGSGAVRITDYNDTLATFNGYYSSEAGALYAPNGTDPFIGSVVMDNELGGRQVFISLVSGNEFTRVFLRNPADPSSISWGLWTTEENIPASVFTAGSGITTEVPDNTETRCEVPEVTMLGDQDTYARSSVTLNVIRPGVYTGHIWVRFVEVIDVDYVLVEFPNGEEQGSDFVYNLSGERGLLLPLNFVALNDEGFIQARVKQTSGSVANVEFNRLHVTRIGDAL